MSSGSYFDIWTAFLYIFVGVLGGALISSFKKNIAINNKSVLALQHRKEKVCIILFFILYVFLAVFRKVGYELGGTDAANYIDNFNTILRDGGIDRTGNVELEPGFQLLTKLVRRLTDNYKFYYFICYGIIVYGYIRFLRDVCPRGGSYIPFILLMYPFFRGFNTMRTSLAISFILIGLCYLDKKKWLSLVFFVLSVFFHRVSLLFALVWPYYVFFNKAMRGLTRNKFALISIGGVLLTFIVAMYLRHYMILFSLLEKSEISYMSSVLDDNILMRWPLYLGPLMLFVAIFVLYKRISWNEQSIFLRTLFIFDIWMIPAALVLGMWRFMEFFYLVRLSLWSIIIPVLVGRKSVGNIVIIKSIAMVVFVAWLFIRVFKEWEATSVSPYILDIF